MTLGIMNESSDRGDLIQLEPLVHQVGGHSSMFVLDDVTVCKPLIGREYQFYRTLPSEIRKYTPEFRGSLQVVLQEDGNGLSMAALPNEQTISLTQRPFKNGRRLRQLSTSSIDYESSSSDEESASLPHNASAGSSLYSAVSLTEGEPKNPWLEECHQSHLHRLKLKSNSSGDVVECIMLENLTFKFRYPCVLDLKMGTRQYGDDAPESKRRSQTSKAANTTTISLGVRLAGMQVYNKERKCFTCKNKYYGRQLTEEGFKQALRQFLHNGKKLQLDIADAIITKLKELRSIISKLDSFRFFTSSLLILYDSVDHIKFSMGRSSDERQWGNPNRENCVPGDISNLKENSPEELRSPRDRASWLVPVPSHSSNNNNNSGSGKGVLRDPLVPEAPAVYKATKSRLTKQRGALKPRVDIRLIDFAHATHKEMNDGIIYKGPDEGILLGLDSLIKLFQEIRDSVER